MRTLYEMIKGPFFYLALGCFGIFWAFFMLCWYLLWPLTFPLALVLPVSLAWAVIAAACLAVSRILYRDPRVKLGRALAVSLSDHVFCLAMMLLVIYLA